MRPSGPGGIQGSRLREPQLQGTRRQRAPRMSGARFGYVTVSEPFRPSVSLAASGERPERNDFSAPDVSRCTVVPALTGPLHRATVRRPDGNGPERDNYPLRVCGLLHELAPIHGVMTEWSLTGTRDGKGVAIMCSRAGFRQGCWDQWSETGRYHQLSVRDDNVLEKEPCRGMPRIGFAQGVDRPDPVVLGPGASQSVIQPGGVRVGYAVGPFLEADAGSS